MKLNFGFKNHTKRDDGVPVSTIANGKNHQPKDETDYKKVGSREFWDISVWVVKFFHRLEPRYFKLYMLFEVLSSMYGLVNAFLFAKIVDILIDVSIRSTGQISDLYPYIGIIVVYGLVNRVLGFFDAYSAANLRLLTGPKISRSFYEKLNSLGIQALEQPGTNDRIYRSLEYMGSMFDFVNAWIHIFSSFVQIVLTLVIVAGFFPIFIPIIILIAIPYFLNDRKYRGIAYKFIFDETHNSRKADMSGGDLSEPVKLTELGVIKALRFLDAKYFDYKYWHMERRAVIQRNWRLLNSSFAFMSDLATYLGFIVVFAQLLKKMISVGDVTFRTSILSRFQSTLTDVIRHLNDQMELAIRMREIYLLFTSRSTFADGATSFPKLTKGPEIVIKGVSFKYPNSERLIFNNLSLKIKGGEKVAIVGHNGAGKTTLVKLLCRIYKPTSGEIVVNGQDLSTLKIDSWYQNMGVLFQEFNTYPQLTVRENIVIGNPNEPVDEVALHLAAQSADASSFIDEFPAKYDQILSEKFKGGIRPSTGQWQKLAIARFFYRNAPLVVFDEPTASIDAVSEYNIFNRIYDFFKDKTVIIISHRFSTVRNADRIIVLDHGEIIEEGTHEFLMSNNGYYAKAFNLQAKGYNNSDE